MTPHSFSRWSIVLALALTVAIYANGLGGPFLFDDQIHITQNRWVQIDALDWHHLYQAWNSSFSDFPSNRPLAQLSFGVTHALAGLDPWAYKAVNLFLHLFNGLAVFLFSRLVYRCVRDEPENRDRERLVAFGVAAAWLLHPLHVSTVLYSVQRMTQISSLSLVLATSAYLWGRLLWSRGRSGITWMLASVPMAAIGFLGKENAVLLPLLLLVCELTLLQRLGPIPRPRVLQLVRFVLIVLPLLLGFAYLLSHPGLLNHDGRPFTLEERLLTQARVLWHYLHWLFVPDITALGLFHDDIPTSTGLLSPPTTLISILALAGIAAAALLLRRRHPVFAFAVLFFLASHALESTIFPLEMIFEHRNYLASVGPLFLLVWVVVVESQRFGVRRLALAFGSLLLIAYTAATTTRVSNWSSYESFVLASAENHPASPRSNFMAGQVLISAVGKSESNRNEFATTARQFLRNGLAADPNCMNCLFGLIVLDLHLGLPVDNNVVQRLTALLRDGETDPTKLSVGQFSYLVRWQRAGPSGLSRDQLEGLFEAALDNTRWNHTGRASIEAAYREYYRHVAKNLEAALLHARAALRAWSEPWAYHMAVVDLLQELGRLGEAMDALEGAAKAASNEQQIQQTKAKRKEIERLNSNG